MLTVVLKRLLFVKRGCGSLSSFLLEEKRVGGATSTLSPRGVHPSLLSEEWVVVNAIKVGVG